MFMFVIVWLTGSCGSLLLPKLTRKNWLLMLLMLEKAEEQNFKYGFDLMSTICTIVKLKMLNHPKLGTIPNLLTRPYSFSLLGYTLLHCAAAWGRLETLKALVELDVDIEALNFREEKARDVAARYSQTECVEFLDRAGKEAQTVLATDQ